jgi:glycerophosphoryl diester phosphodiesterase
VLLQKNTAHRGGKEILRSIAFRKRIVSEVQMACALGAPSASRACCGTYTDCRSGCVYISSTLLAVDMLKIGHRGARAYEPENTLLSYKKALELGVDAVELDVRRTKDGELVVIHDPEVDRTTDGKGLVSDLTLKQVKQFKTEKDQRIPTLEEALDFLDRKVKVLVELKETGYEDKVLRLVQSKASESNVIIVSFHEEALRKVRELSEQVETGLIYARHKNPVKAASDLKANYLLPLYRFTHSADVQKAHQNGLKVIVWTINKPEEVAEYGKKGVDGITSDRPDILVKAAK